MEIKDLAGLSKPLCKLISTFQDSCSWLSKPNQIKRLASATSEASSTENISDFKKKLQQSLLADTIDATHSVREKRQFDNMSNIYEFAAQELKMIEQVDNTPVDPDWSAYFFDYAKDVSDEEFQILWAKILVGEIKSPNTYFKRTLFALKHIEKQEAECFVEICSYLINYSFFPDIMLKYGAYPFTQFKSLCDCGLITEIKCQYDVEIDDTEIKGKTISIRLLCDRKSEISILGYALTDAGIQISNLIQIETDRDFMETLNDHIKNEFAVQTELL